MLGFISDEGGCGFTVLLPVGSLRQSAKSQAEITVLDSSQESIEDSRDRRFTNMVIM